MDYNPSGSTVHGILEARLLEWVAISFSRDFPDPGIKPRSPTLQADSYIETITMDPIIHLLILLTFTEYLRLGSMLEQRSKQSQLGLHILVYAGSL